MCMSVGACPLPLLRTPLPLFNLLEKPCGGNLRSQFPDVSPVTQATLDHLALAKPPADHKEQPNPANIAIYKIIIISH